MYDKLISLGHANCECLHLLDIKRFLEVPTLEYADSFGSKHEVSCPTHSVRIDFLKDAREHHLLNVVELEHF